MDTFLQIELAVFLLMIATTFAVLFFDTPLNHVIDTTTKKKKMIIMNPVLNTGYIDDNKTKHLLKFIFYSAIILTVIYLLGIFLMLRV